MNRIPRGPYSMDGYSMVIVATVVLVVLILVKLHIQNTLPKTRNRLLGKYDIGNAQLKGVSERQNDYFAVYPNKGAILAAIADGVGQYIEGRFAAVFAIETLKQNFDNRQSSIQEYFRISMGDVLSRFNQREFSRTVGVSLICAVFHNHMVSWAGIGDTVLYLYRSKELIRLFLGGGQDFGEKQYQHGDVFLLLSGGGANYLDEYELIYLLSQNNNANDKAQSIARRVKKKGYRRQQNATIVIIEIV